MTALHWLIVVTDPEPEARAPSEARSAEGERQLAEEASNSNTT